jgi:hypothetical protein
VGSTVDAAVVVGTVAAVGAAGAAFAEGVACGVAEAPAEARGLAEPDAATGGAGAAGSPSTSSSLPAEIVPSPVMFTDAATGLDALVSLSAVPPMLATVIDSGAVPPLA